MAAKMLVAGPAANIRIRSLLGAFVNSSYWGSANAPNGSGPNWRSPNERILMPWALACKPWPNSCITKATMNAKAPHPSGITGFNPGIATSSLALGGGVCGGENSAVMNAITISSPTSSIEKTQTQRDISP